MAGRRRKVSTPLWVYRGDEIASAHTAIGRGARRRSFEWPETARLSHHAAANRARTNAGAARYWAHRAQQYIIACLRPSLAGPPAQQSRMPAFANPSPTRASRTDQQQARTRMPHPTRNRERPPHAGLHELRLYRATQGQIYSKLWLPLALRRVAQVFLRLAPRRPSEIGRGLRQARQPPPTEPHRNG